MNWEVRVPKNVRKSIKKFPSKDRERILEALRDFEIDPWSGDITKIDEFENMWRRRNGNYRIIYTIKVRENIIEIKKVKRRTSKTY